MQPRVYINPCNHIAIWYSPISKYSKANNFVFKDLIYLALFVSSTVETSAHSGRRFLKNLAWCRSDKENKIIKIFLNSISIFSIRKVSFVLEQALQMIVVSELSKSF